MASLFARLRAERRHEKGCKASDAGDEDAALDLYHQALSLDPRRANTLYNIGLVHKYRQAWAESLAYNQQAFDLRPDDEATRWNLAIAATALGNWPLARRIWALCGYAFDDTGEGPIVSDFGACCVRLNPDDDAEVVWASRIDPVRARITNVPYPESGFFLGDVVLHDGAPAGERVAGDTTVSVFNAFHRTERSEFGTATVQLDAPSAPDRDALVSALADADLYAEDWSANVRNLCKQCSEGTPHAEHDQALTVWEPERWIGIAVKNDADADDVLEGWRTRPGCSLRGIAVDR